MTVKNMPLRLHHTAYATRDLEAAGYKVPEGLELDHGHSESLSVTDPNGMLVELTLDVANVDAIGAEQKKKARAERQRGLAGDHPVNNDYAARSRE